MYHLYVQMTVGLKFRLVYGLQKTFCWLGTSHREGQQGLGELLLNLILPLFRKIDVVYLLHPPCLVISTSFKPSKSESSEACGQQPLFVIAMNVFLAWRFWDKSSDLCQHIYSEKLPCVRLVCDNLECVIMCSCCISPGSPST